MDATTKELLALTLAKLCEQKSFSKITIADITQASGFNRQTFYYHFRDKQELLYWLYQADAQAVFDDSLSFENWHCYLEKLLYRMREHRQIYDNTIRCDDAIFSAFLFSWANDLFSKAILDLDVHHRLLEEDVHFYSDFFSFGISGIVIRWVKSDMLTSPQKLTAELKSLVAHIEKIAYDRYQANTH